MVFFHIHCHTSFQNPNKGNFNTHNKTKVIEGRRQKKKFLSVPEGLKYLHFNYNHKNGVIYDR